MSDKLTAYFCMEYGLSTDFKIYSGGLGILAGDILKAAKDLNKPMVAVGILWRQGYVEQKIDANGKPCDTYHEYSYDFLKDTKVTVTVKIRSQKVKLKVWLCDCFGNVPLYLLDANLPENGDRLITGQLYGWFNEERIAQEIILGVGGVRALRALGICPDIYHFNDSHPMFAGLELISSRIKAGESFEEAYKNVRKTIVFTTHTPVPAGNECHSLKLLSYMSDRCGLTLKQLEFIGGKPFNMTVAGLRLSYIANGVAELHAQTARKMWAHVEDCSPIIAVTNGVHNGTWQNDDIINAFNNNDSLLEVHKKLKHDMLLGIGKRCPNVKLDENVLTIGFARRAAPYKRGTLIFSQPEKLMPLFEEGKLQIIFSGKAHPNDLAGKEIVRQMYELSVKYPNNVVFVPDYDMEVGKYLTSGCDIWLNNPVRPMEASGTSGMKAAMNGVLNFSVLDGWWPEGCEHGVNGWQIGDGYEGEDADKHDADSLFKTLINDIIPTYYGDGKKWESMMRSSVSMASQRFSAARMVEDYYNKMYSVQPK